MCGANVTTIPSFFKAGPKSSKPTSKPTLSHANTESPPNSIDIFSPSTSNSELNKLTPSERFFSLATRIDVRSIEISGDLEWRLFVDLRAEHQWMSHRMPPKRLMEATALYNTKLEQKASEGCQRFVRKHPRAIVSKLAWIEGQVLQRLTTGNFVCK